MVFQNYALYPQMTVPINHFCLECANSAAAEIHRGSPRRRTCSDLHSLSTASRGAVRRSTAARRDGAGDRARPQVFLMDEPLSNLDAKLRVQIRAELDEAAPAARDTTVYVTHDQVEAMTLGDRVWCCGRDVAASRTPQELYDQPENVFVAGFIGSPAMNFLEATLSGATR